MILIPMADELMSVVARAVHRACRDIESLPPSLRFGGAARRGRMGKVSE